eukprot:COSAG05_NODE_14994_length_381_cov_0.875887_2_plen_52_part_01
MVVHKYVLKLASADGAVCLQHNGFMRSHEFPRPLQTKGQFSDSASCGRYIYG